jgi:alpha-mannosidase
VSLTYAGGETVRFGCDPYHREFPIRGNDFTINAEAVARRPFGEPVREPRFEAARLAWVDGPVDVLHRRLALVAEACEALDAHEVVPHLLDAAEAALRSLDWPSATPDYVARIAPQAQQQRIWQ